MKVLIAVSCLLAVASAGFVGHHSAYTYPHLAYAGAHVAYAGAQHLPVIGANGVPVDEPAVQHARAEHAAAHVEAAARNGEVAFVGAHHVAAPVAYAAHVAAPVAYAAGHVYAGPQHLPVIGANGVPVDEPAVQVARAEHAASHVEAKVRNGDAAVVAAHVAAPVAYAAHHVAAPVAYAAHHIAAPVVAHANGAVVPADTVEVAAAKAAHYAAHVEAKVRNGDIHHYAPHLVHYRKRRGVFGYAAPVAYSAPVAHYAEHVYAGPQHLPVIGANGVPVDEPAVQVARAEHAASHVEAKVRNGDAAVVAAHVAAPFAYAAHHVAAPVAYAAGHVYAGPQHLPVIGANGVPVDEPAVQVARAEHAASHIEAKVRNGDAAVVAAYAHHVAAPVAYAHHVAAPVAYAAHHIAAPVVAHANGAVVPADTVEVAAAKAAHYAAHVEAKVRNGDLHHVPVVHAY